ncbi:glucosamine inositolphosphorylceramide transferase family protein [Tahibacter amnicola]|uniref:Glucosamine inositolphosphorylceramide transferase 1 N-terminal domain-containing protein n=1 Tax=Tahibacter amnicola TaxID=2976241 RepID=A0ABY6B8E1_9GAMM|nr:hypothetical protein [Tahibacter amnicola]UXI66351.1 hypothetical protein N4264_16530 [Tahibacter amnicola]
MADGAHRLKRSRLHREPVGPALRVVVLLGARRGPRWLAESLAALQECPFLDVTVLRTGESVAQLRHRTFDTYLALDARLAGPMRTILEETPLLGECVDAPALDGVAGATGCCVASDDARAAIRQHQPDVLLIIGHAPPHPDLAALATTTWTLDADATSSLRCGAWMLPAFRAGHVSATVGLRVHDAGRDAWILLEPGVISVAQISFTRHRAYQLQKAPAQLTRALRRLACGQPPRAAVAEPGAALPGPLQTGWLGMCLLARGLRRHFYRPLRRESWSIALRRSQTGIDPADPHFSPDRVLHPPRGWFWADPAPVHHEGRFYILVEAYHHRTRRGEIHTLELDDALNVVRIERTLQRPYHLSYPHLLEWQGRSCLVMESALAERVELLGAVTFPSQWQSLGQLLNGWRVVDATLIAHDGRWWMFACVAETVFNDDGREWNELFLFHAPSPEGPWTPHAQNPVCSDVHRARPAGPLFVRDGRLIRPGQDCAAEYGRAIVFHEIRVLDPERYEECVLGTLEPTWAGGLRGCHTYARHGDIDVVDVKHLTARVPVGAAPFPAETKP